MDFECRRQAMKIITLERVMAQATKIVQSATNSTFTA